MSRSARTPKWAANYKKSKPKAKRARNKKIRQVLKKTEESRKIPKLEFKVKKS